jgi:hypothetical protein
MKPRMTGFFEQGNAVAALGEQRCCRRAGRTAADHQHVTMGLEDIRWNDGYVHRCIGLVPL